jgi:hypothetical protein
MFSLEGGRVHLYLVGLKTVIFKYFSAVSSSCVDNFFRHLDALAFFFGFQILILEQIPSWLFALDN